MKINSSVSFYFEDTAFSGVHKIAEKVMHDIELVTGTAPVKGGEDSSVVFGTVGKSSLIDRLESEGKIDLSEVKGKREVYGFFVLENQIVIAGSDKRGTIYGLFHLSELLGVSPLVDWCNIKPAHKDEVEITSEDTVVSKEPSVRFRGFFINDEWPAFGNWSGKNFGGVNAKCYEHVFELLLRLKGNYLWPAMWASRFSDDGPGLLNAELADELGVVMGASHHEPCCRAGEEYKYLRGPGSIYGDAWNFIKNEQGITKFWEDGLKRNGKFDNVITVGMRGEADTAIMQNATLKDNIDLLRNVLKTQNRLIRENVNENLEEVPRMLALYKEVEPYFYGDKKTKGLMGDPELENVILMLCDDNHGNLRTVPTKEMRKHKGGYGMYYHFDYHGSPFSYEWINTTHIAKVREQMCAAYDFGIQDLWIVNVGDILTNEFPLSYFLNLAYDYEKYSDVELTAEKYTRQWVSFQFPGFTKEQQDDAVFIINGYTKLSHRCRTEALTSETYHAVNYGESDETLALAEDIMNRCKKLKGEVSEKDFSGFFAQIYYPAMGNMNVLKMQLLAGKNHWYASKGILAANDLVPEIKKCIEFDHALVKELDAVDGGKYYGQGWSQHIGFKHWNEEENQYPVYMTVEPADKKRLCVWVEGNDEVTSGLDWTKRRLYSFAFQDPECKSFVLNIGTASNQTTPFRLECDRDWISFSQKEGDVSGTEIKKIEVFVDREKLEKDNDKGCYVFVTNDDRSAGGVKVPVFVEAGTAQWVSNVTGCEIPENTICQKGPYISIDAADFSESFAGTDTEGRVTGFEVLPDYGKLNSAVKVESATSYFRDDLKDAPCLKYNFALASSGDGILKVDFYMNPSNPATQDNYFRFGAAVNGKKVTVDCVDENFHVGDNQEPWGTDVTNNIRVKSAYFECKEGLNTLEVFAVTPNFVLEKIVMYTTDAENLIKKSYLGPKVY